MQVAGAVAAVTANFDSTIEYCRPYLTEEAPDFSITVTQEQMDFEQTDSIREALEEGIRPRKYTGPYLERAAIRRQFADFLYERDTLLFHGSTVAVDGVAYLFTAPCGTGKSTHTRLWCQVFGDRAVMVNDDKPFLRLDGENVLACGSPWCGKHGLGTNIQVPLGGICLLERGLDNEIRPLSPADAMDWLAKQAYCPASPAAKQRFAALVARLAGAVPLWRMTCNKEPEAALVAYAAMERK